MKRSSEGEIKGLNGVPVKIGDVLNESWIKMTSFATQTSLPVSVVESLLITRGPGVVNCQRRFPGKGQIHA